MEKEHKLSTGGFFGSMKPIIAFLAVLAVLMGFSRLANADIADCFKSVKRSQIDGREFTVVVFNSEKRCDLYMAARMFPQLDANTKEPLPPQVQLRSMYAANTKVQFGNREVRTVLARCVPDSKPWPDQTAEERDMCPDLKVNYFQNGFGGAVMIPQTRMLTYTEKLESAFSKACLNFGSRQEPSEQEKEILLDCQKLIAGFEYKSLSEKEATVEAPVLKTDDNQTALLVAEIKDLQANIARLEPKAQKGVWLWPLFSLMVGFAIFGASGTIFGIKERRIRKEADMRHKLFVQSSREVVIKSKEASVFRNDTEELSRKIEKRLRDEMEKKYRERITSERNELEKQFEAKYNGISANLAKKNLDLEQALAKARDELIRASETLTKELRLKITHLTEECDKERSRADDLRVETEALKQELGNAERRCTQSADELLMFKDKFAESELEIKALEQLNLELKQEAEEFAGKAERAEMALQALEQRYVELLAAQDVLSNAAKGSRKSDYRKTLPIGAAPTEAFGVGPEDSTYSMVLERGKMRDDQYDEKDKENISSSRFGSAESGGGEDGVIRNPMITEMDELRPMREKDSLSEEKTLTEFRLDRDSDDPQESAEIIPRTSHESHTACKAERLSSDKEDDEKARDAS